MIETSNETIILCDHSKFESIAFVKICSFDQVDLVITERKSAKTPCLASKSSMSMS
jgi:DeoR/GlpR family transcriptional regulator of sugar metabolism